MALPYQSLLNLHGGHGAVVENLSPEQLDDLIPAYCVTVHRAQGSEARAVVIVLADGHHVMLRRNLLYTAVTRGKELVVIVSGRYALRKAVANAEENARCGGLSLLVRIKRAIAVTMVQARIRGGVSNLRVDLYCKSCLQRLALFHHQGRLEPCGAPESRCL